MAEVNHPSYYNTGSVECIEAIKSVTSGIEDGYLAFLTGQVIKYIWRWYNKNGIEDLEKCTWYLDRLKEEVPEETDDFEATREKIMKGFPLLEQLFNEGS